MSLEQKQFQFVISNASDEDMRYWFQPSSVSRFGVESFQLLPYVVEKVDYTMISVSVNECMTLRDFLKLIAVIIPDVSSIMLIKEVNTYALDWAKTSA